MVLSLLLSVWVAQTSGCTKDTDCKGERICEAGACVAPQQTAAPPPPLPAATVPPADAASYPRVVRRDGLTCVQSLDDAGRVQEACRREDTSYGRPRPLAAGAARQAEVEETPRARPPEVTEPGARFVLDALLQGGLTIATAPGILVALPQVSGTVALGARFRAGIGVQGLVNLSGSFRSGFSAIAFTVAPALRFGNQSHFTLALGPSVLGATGAGTGVVGSLIAQCVFAVGDAFVLAIQAALHADASGVLFMLGAGFGFGVL